MNQLIMSLDGCMCHVMERIMESVLLPLQENLFTGPVNSLVSPLLHHMIGNWKWTFRFEMSHELPSAIIGTCSSHIHMPNINHGEATDREIYVKILVA